MGELRCDCGHLRISHYVIGRLEPGKSASRGPCRVTGCECARFRDQQAPEDVVRPDSQEEVAILAMQVAFTQLRDIIKESWPEESDPQFLPEGSVQQDMLAIIYRALSIEA